MAKTKLSQASFVERGYGQVEPNHLSAKWTGQIYAQLPANADIDILENGQFVKYDYANHEVNFTGKGEWMLVYNETKLYREEQLDCEFAMVKDNYGARVYSPLDGEKAQEMYGPTRFLQGVREIYNAKEDRFEPIDAFKFDAEGKLVGKNGEGVTPDFSVASGVHDYYEMSDINNPDIPEGVRRRLFMKLREYEEKMMPTGTTMVPRVFKTNVGDIMTTNTINGTPETVVVGATLTPGAKGILEVTESTDGMLWQVVKVYTMPDHQRGVKIMRIQ